MILTRIREISSYRWAAAIIANLVLMLISELSAAAPAQPAYLGLRVRDEGSAVVVTWVQPAGLAWHAGVRAGDRLLAIAGVSRIEDGLATLNAAREVSVVSARSNKVLTVTADSRVAVLSPAAFWSFPLVATCFMIIGIIVFVLAADGTVAWCVFGVTISMAMALMADPAARFGSTWSLTVIYLGLQSFAASMFLLFLVFPVDRLHTRAGRVAAIASLGATGALMLGYVWMELVDSSSYEVLRSVSSALLILEMLGACALIGLTLLRKGVSPLGSRYALDLLLLGPLASVLPFSLLVIGPTLFGLPPLVPPELAISTVVLLPLSLGVVVLRGQFSLLEHVARRGLVALIVWMTLLVAYSILFMSLVWPSDLDSRPLSSIIWMAPLWIAAIAGTFPLLQRLLQRWIERTLFHDVYVYADTLQHMSTAISRYTTVADIARHVLEQLGQTLSLRWATLALQPEATPDDRFEWGDPPAADAARPARASRRAADLAREEQARLVDLVAGGTVVGTLVVGPKRHVSGFTSQDEAFITTLAPLVATALQNALLIRRLQDQVATLAEREQSLAALSTQLMQVQEEERQRITLDLHDDAVQRAMLLERELTEAEASPEVLRWRQAVEDIVAALRAVCAGLRPPVLDDLGLAAGIEWLVNDMRAQTDLDVELDVTTFDGAPFGRLEGALEIALYRVAQEALTNCRKHAQASRVVVRLRRDPDQVLLQVADDGRGFDMAAEQGPSTLHLGILGMRQRLRLWPSAIAMERRLGGGTIVSIKVRLRKKSEYAEYREND